MLPNVVGSDYEEAKLRLEELGFVCQRNEISQGNHRENEIVSMSPSYEKAYPPGTTVYLIVYTPETELVTDENGEIIPPEELEEDENSAEDTPSADGEEYVPEEE